MPSKSHSEFVISSALIGLLSLYFRVFARILDNDRANYKDLDVGEEDLDVLADVDVEANQDF